MTDDQRQAAVLSSPANPRIRAAAALRDRRERSTSGLTIIDGARELRRALAAGVEVIEAFVCEPLLAGADARAALDGLEGLAATGVPVHRTTKTAFAKLAFGERAEGLVAVIRSPSLSLAGLDLPDDGMIVVIEGVEKPGNVGAILRSADGAGAAAVIAASARTDLTNPNVIRASAGTLFTVPLAAADSDAVLTWLRARGTRLFAARVEGALAYTDADLRGDVALILGAEDRGLTPVWDAADITAVHLPMAGIADSLNVSVTAAVLLYEARRQRDRHPGEAD
jgi:TrmH family RNA methyltransferase